MDETSLDDFLDSEGDDGADHEADEATPDREDDAEVADAETEEASEPAASDTADTAAADERSPAPDEDPGAVEPAVTTYQWTPAGATCAVCGDQTERRWQSDDGLVCPDCKEW